MHRREGLQANGPKYLDHKLECPHWLTIRLRIPVDARPETNIVCDGCGRTFGTWDELQIDFEKQGGNAGVFCIEKGAALQLTKGDHRGALPARLACQARKRLASYLIRRSCMKLRHLRRHDAGGL